jgi:hypothetical protein
LPKATNSPRACPCQDNSCVVNELAATLPRILNSPLGYPETLAELWMGDRRDGRDDYLERVRRLGILVPEAAWFTDKMPLNETISA